MEDFSEQYLQDRQSVAIKNTPGSRLREKYKSGYFDNKPEPPSEQPQDGKGIVGKTVETAAWLARPFGFMSSFGLAPIAHDYESDTFIGKTVEALKVGTKAAVDDLFPQPGQIPDHAGKVREKYFPEIPDVFKPSADMAIAIISDPAWFALPFTKSIRAGLQVSAATKTESGPFKNALEEFVSVVPMKDEQLTKLTKIAKQADSGDQVAVKKLMSETAGMSEAEKIKKNIAVVDPDVERVLKNTIGDQGKPAVSIGKKAQKVITLQDRDLPKHSLNLNLSRVNTPDDVKQVMDKVTRSNEKQLKAIKGSQSHKETEKLADMLDLSMDDLLSRRTSDFTPAEALSARQMLVASAEKLQTLAKAVNSPNAGDIDKVAFMKALTLHKAIREQVTGITAEAGRLLSQFNIQSQGTNGKLKHIDAILGNMGGDANKISEIAELMGGMDGFRQIDKMSEGLWKARTSDVIMEAWINGLLSGPQTHAVNMTSNTLVAAWQIPERLMAAGFSKVLRSGDDAVRFGEAQAQAYGVINGFMDGLKAGFKEVLEDSSDIATKLELPHRKAITSEALEVSGPIGRAVDMLGSAIRSPGKALQVEDAFFKGIGYRMELQARAYRQAVAEGLTGKELAKRIKNIVANPPEDLQLVAVDAARYQTFTKELIGVGKTYQDVVNKHPSLRVITPFIRTPANVLKFAVERSPLAPVLKEFRMAYKAGGSQRDIALARVSLGSLVMAMSAKWGAEGRITGGGPTEPAKRSTKYMTGWQPYSIQVGDTYYSFGRLEPLGTLLGLGADFADISGELEDAEANEVAAMIVTSMMRNVTNKTFLRGLSDLVKVMTEPERYSEGYIRNLMTTLVPFGVGVAQLERTQDPTLREARTALDKVKSRIPGYSKTLPARKNIFAEPIVLSGGFGPDIMSPIYTSEIKDDTISRSINESGVIFSMPKDIVDGVDLTPEQYDRLIELTASGGKFGPSLKEEWTEMVTKHLDYKLASQDGKAYLINRLISLYKRIGKEELKAEYPDLERKIEERRDQMFSERGL